MVRVPLQLMAAAFIALACDTAGSNVNHHEPISDEEHLQNFLDKLQDPACNQSIEVTEDRKVIQTLLGDPTPACHHTYLIIAYMIEMDLAAHRIVYDPFITPKERTKQMFLRDECVEAVTLTEDGFLVLAREGMGENCAEVFPAGQRISEREVLFPYKADHRCNINQPGTTGTHEIVFTGDMTTEQGNSPAAGMWGASYAKATIGGMSYEFAHCEIEERERTPMGYVTVCYDPALGSSPDQPKVEMGLGGWGALVAQFSKGSEKVELICKR
ncbi:MAG: hypothetical protein AB7T49_11405 [Oligoflexales bacterium]